MRVGLFIPCYIDQLYPDVGMATVDVLEACGVEVDFPVAQTCCGQPMSNTGCTPETRPLAERFLQIFGEYSHVVCPSGSCVAMVRHHYGEYFEGDSAYTALQANTYELCEFLVKVVADERWPAGRFPHRVGIHQSCHGLRELRLGSGSERVVAPQASPVRQLLERFEGIQFVELERVDECCGFGGTFAVNEDAVSCMMGNDRIADHQRAGAEVITAADMSCLMHLGGLISRQRKPLRVMHVAEILAGRSAAPDASA